MIVNVAGAAIPKTVFPITDHWVYLWELSISLN